MKYINITRNKEMGLRSLIILVQIEAWINKAYFDFENIDEN